MAVATHNGWPDKKCWVYCSPGYRVKQVRSPLRSSVLKPYQTTESSLRKSRIGLGLYSPTRRIRLNFGGETKRMESTHRIGISRLKCFIGVMNKKQNVTALGVTTRLSMR